MKPSENRSSGNKLSNFAARSFNVSARTLLLASSLILAALVAVLLISGNRRAKESNNWVEHTYLVLNRSEALLFELLRNHALSENDPLQAVTAESLRDRKEFKKLLMDQVRAEGGTGAIALKRDSFAAIDSKHVFQGLIKDTLEAFLELEMEERLGYPKHDAAGRHSGSNKSPNGRTVPWTRSIRSSLWTACASRCVPKRACSKSASTRCWASTQTAARDLKPICRAPTAAMAELALAQFRAKYPGTR